MTRVALAAGLVTAGATLLTTDALLGWAMLWGGVVLGIDGLATRPSREE